LYLNITLFTTDNRSYNQKTGVCYFNCDLKIIRIIVMKHLEPSPKPITNSKKKSSSHSKFKQLLIAATLVAGIGFGMTTMWQPYSTDNISEAQKSELVANFAKLQSIEVVRIASQDIDNALDSMNLPPDQKQQLKTTLLSSSNNTSIQNIPPVQQQSQNKNIPPINGNPSQNITHLQADNTGLVWLSLWDFADPDGDIVHVSSAGYEMDIPLKKIQDKIAIPIDAAKTIKITGIHDGGGGITLGVNSGSTPVAMPILKEGQILALPVSF
jgi:hypothetical protein